MGTNTIYGTTTVTAAALALALVPGNAAADDDDLPLKVAAIIIETTADDIELQWFVDGSNWHRFQMFDPDEKRVLDLRTRRNLKRQGMSEVYFASNPDPFPEDDFGDIDPRGAARVIRNFLRKWPAGTYEFEAQTEDGELEGDGVLTHVLPALPQILAPVSDTDDPPLVDPDDVVIEWESVETRLLGRGPVEIIEYQVIVDQAEPLREQPWVDGANRRALINVPGDVTQLTVPPEFLLRDTLYDFEILAIERSGNVTIAEGEFMTE